MSNPTTVPQSIQDQVIERIKTLPQQLERGRRDGEWTIALKRRLGDLGKENGWQVSTAGFQGEFDGEWLFDLAWFRNTQVYPHHILELGLVLESEWLRDHYEIKYDFEKLLVAKAPLKVMIFQDNGNEDDKTLPELWAMLEAGIRSFQTGSEGEKYILAAFREFPHEFEIRVL